MASSRSQSPNQLTAKQAIFKLERDRDPLWVHAEKEVYRSVLEIAAQHQNESRKGLHLLKIMRGPTSPKTIMLTFDDGPHPDFTDKIVGILSRYGVRATFFVVGSQAEKFPDLVRHEVAGGHVVGNHTYHHVSLTKIPPEYAAEEIRACGEVIRDITGKAPSYFRPPGGDYDAEVGKLANALGYTLVLWTDDPGDYKNLPTAQLLNRTVREVSDGGIILLHDGASDTLHILPQLIEGLKAKGFRFVTPEDMASPKPR
ncbi:MAG: polysaccharide deacetylase family protein [Fimbriimonadales bacterium]